MLAIHPDFPNHFSLPRRISRLGQLAYNLWWVWNPEGQMVFSQIDKSLWERMNHNPVAFLHKVDRPRLNAMTNDRYYLDFYDRVMHNFDQYLKSEDTWFQRTYPDLTDKTIAYFSFEFGLHEALPVYAGGLGVLSGDHLKGASDMGMPVVAVGFVYNQGYFSQRITEDGWQETRNLMLNFEEMPIVPLLTAEKKPAMISVDLPGRKVWARLWTVNVGRVSLYLLDTNVDENSPADRQLTARLYSNDLEIRISQEILLGMGGVRALRLLGLQPDIWHMNEGHSAFLALERRWSTWRKAIRLNRPPKKCARPASSPPIPRFRPETTSSRCGWWINTLPNLAAARPGPRTIYRPGPPTPGLGRIVRHAGAGAQTFATQQRRFRTARPGFSQDVAVFVARPARG